MNEQRWRPGTWFLKVSQGKGRAGGGAWAWSWLAGSLAVAWSSVACGTAVRAGVDWERGVDFKAVKTFNVSRSPLLPKDLNPQQEKIVQVAENTTKEQLILKGYQEAPADQAQLIATTHFLMQDRTRVTTFPCDNYWGYEAYAGAVMPAGTVPPCQESVLTDFEEATMLIDLYDTERKQLVWHGWATAQRPEPGSSDAEKLVARAATDILDRFPP